MATLSTALPTDIPDAAAPRPRKRSRSLAHDIVEGIGAQIQSGALKPGGKLPTESAIMASCMASAAPWCARRLSRLQAAGLVETRHGVGTFVLEPRAGGHVPAWTRLGHGHGGGRVGRAGVAHQPGDRVGGSGGTAPHRGAAGRHCGPRWMRSRPAWTLRVGGDDAVTVSPDLRFHLAHRRAPRATAYFADIMGHLGAGRDSTRTGINSPILAMDEPARRVPACG
jgi:GntR family transcriptional repressor for pyruvate dehydrogenase complex